MLLNFLWNVIAFIIALGTLITVHEFGHFLAARFCKVKIERFSIGFGPILWRWRDSNNIEYVISMIFVGGYVKLCNTNMCDINDNVIHTFNYKNIWQKIIIVMSGSIFNFIFSILLYTLVYMIGIPTQKPIIQSIIPNSIVANSGMSSGLEIKSINNIQTHNWESVRFQILNNIEKEIFIISATSPNNVHFNTYTIHVPKYWFNTHINIDPVISLGILPYNVQIIPILSNVQPNSVAERIGLKIGDKILAINDQIISDWDSFIISIKNKSKKNFKISVERKHEILNFHVALDEKYLINSNRIEGVIGIFPKTIIVPTKNYVINQYKLHIAVLQACNKTWELSYLIINMLIKLIFGDIKMIDIGGPISIAQGAGNAAQFGLVYYLMFLAVISINLGIINLLPFPTLDGGRLFFLILEKINGKPISQKIQNFGHIIGIILLILIMCFTFLNDISRLW